MLSPHVRFALAVLVALASVSPLAAQDTRGSLVPDTLVDKFDGTKADVQDLAVGDELWTLGTDGKVVVGLVTAVRRQHADSYVQIKVGSLLAEATGSHRIAVPGGKFVRFDALKVGDPVLVWGPKGPEEKAITSIRQYPANLIAYDLTVEGHRAFRVNGILLAD